MSRGLGLMPRKVPQLIETDADGGVVSRLAIPMCLLRSRCREEAPRGGAPRGSPHETTARVGFSGVLILAERPALSVQ